MEVTDAWQEVHCGADRGQVERGRAAPGPGPDHPAAVQEAADLRPDLLPLAPEVRGAQGGRGPATEGPRAGERPPQAHRGRAGPGHLHAEGPRAGKMVSPARRRDAAN